MFPGVDQSSVFGIFFGRLALLVLCILSTGRAKSRIDVCFCSFSPGSLAKDDPFPFSGYLFGASFFFLRGGPYKRWQNTSKRCKVQGKGNKDSLGCRTGHLTDSFALFLYLLVYEGQALCFVGVWEDQTRRGAWA